MRNRTNGPKKLKRHLAKVLKSHQRGCCGCGARFMKSTHKRNQKFKLKDEL